MPIFNQSGFGQNEAGSKYLTPGTLRLAGVSAIVCILFGVHTVAVPLAAHGSSSTTTSVCKTYRRALSSAGSSSMVAVGMTVQPVANGQGYGRNEYGSPYLTPGTLFAQGSSGMVCSHSSAHHVPLSAAGHAAVNLGFLRTIRRGLSSTGSSSAVVVLRHYGQHLSSGLISNGSSTMTAGWIRRKRPSTNLVSAGSSHVAVNWRHILRRGLHFYGSSLAVAVGRNNSFLPPTVMIGFRVTNYSRPAATLGIRCTAWTRPAPQANLRFTRWTSPV